MKWTTLVALALAAACTSSPAPLAMRPIDDRVFASCEDAVQDAWELAECARTDAVMVVAQRRAGSGVLPVWSAILLGRSGPGWRAVRREEGPQDTWSSVAAKRLGDALVVGYRYAGTGQVLDYEVVVAGPRVAARRDGLQRGSVRIRAGAITEYAADYPNDEPTCCPPRYTRSELIRDGSRYRLVRRGFVEPDDVPPSEL